MGKRKEINRLLGAALGQDGPIAQAEGNDQSQALHEMLVLEGISLATEQPEFRRGNIGGRPKSGITEDRLLALFIDDLQTNTVEFEGKEVIEIIGIMKKTDAILGLPPGLSRLIEATPRSLVSKVSRGRRKNRESMKVVPGSTPNHRRLIDSVRGAGGGAACKDPRFVDLCKRLDIDSSLPIEMKLIMVRERILDTDQANVRDGKGKKVSGEDLLALIVDDIKAHHPKHKGATVREILEFLQSGNAGEWRPWYASKLEHAADFGSLLQKVSRGRSGSYYALRREALDRMARALLRGSCNAETAGENQK